MANHQDRIDQLNRKLELLLGEQEALKARQKNFAINLMEIYQEIEAVKQIRPDDLMVQDSKTKDGPELQEPKKKDAYRPKELQDNAEAVDDESNIKTDALAPSADNDFVLPHAESNSGKTVDRSVTPPATTQTADLQVGLKNPVRKSNLEKFIGENLISKFGIAITVIGVGIFAKYSIENNLISPLTRIVIGYLAGLGLVGFGIKLKAKYANFSAILVSGALAIMYFITFAAYSFYGLFPQLMAFGLMLLFTVFGVVAALNYNKQVIAHIGLVGAYAVPFLLSNGSGEVVTLFSYMAIINVGILVLSFKKYWKPLFYSAFGLTWLIYISWYGLSYISVKHFTPALVFVSLFFVIFYISFLAYKLVKSEKFVQSDVVLILLNSFIFYALGYGLLNHYEPGKQLLGLFTLVNAIIHFAVATLIHKKKLADRNLFYLISGMVLIFITIAIPVQLDGNWVTLLWTLQAALLFWVGRTKGIPFYEKLSYPLMILGFLSLTQDWAEGYGGYFGNAAEMRPILNTYFLTSVLFIIAFAGIQWINSTRPASEENRSHLFSRVMAHLIPTLLIGTTYATFFLEIEHYGQQQYYASEISETMANGMNVVHHDHSLTDINHIRLLIYTLFYLSALSFVNIKKIANRVLGIVTLVFGAIATLLFLGGGLFALSEIRESYISRGTNVFYDIPSLYIGIRYVAFAFFALMLVAMRNMTRQPFMKINLRLPFEIGVHVCILWILSSELLNLMDLAGSNQTYKLGLSILWGLYALLLIALGIKKSKAYLRIGGMVLFGITLLKLFFYDIASLDTISKTVVFMSLGILLLIVSFLYNKYKDRISADK